jgi:DNA-binding FadR family transcriptional regulator
MTRQAKSIAAAAPVDNLVSAPVRAMPGLAALVTKELRDGITSGRLAPGARLPTEQSLMRAMGVSRTVVREAVAALRAEGLVSTRQGAGAFVADPGARGFRIDPGGLASIDDVMDVLELRLAIEQEAAALAAERSSLSSRRKIDAALTAFEQKLNRSGEAIAEDVEFHRAIAAATGNRHFLALLASLGTFIIPRRSFSLLERSHSEHERYLRGILEEHRMIFAAIEKRDAARARAAMRTHLERSRQRYGTLVAPHRAARLKSV